MRAGSIRACSPLVLLVLLPRLASALSNGTRHIFPLIIQEFVSQAAIRVGCVLDLAVQVLKHDNDVNDLGGDIAEGNHLAIPASAHRIAQPAQTGVHRLGVWSQVPRDSLPWEALNRICDVEGRAFYLPPNPRLRDTTSRSSTLFDGGLQRLSHCPFLSPGAWKTRRMSLSLSSTSRGTVSRTCFHSGGRCAWFL